jgi:hypothetical protein
MNGESPWLSGGCHCGAVRFRVRPTTRELTDCNCSMCGKKGILHLIVGKDDFELLSGQEQLSLYQFNTKVARHLFCRVCGIHSFYVPRSHPDGVDVNARCLDDVDLSTFTIRQFDGRHWEAARASLP